MNWNNIKGMIFDFDGTLADSMSMWENIGFEILDNNNISYPDDLINIITPLGSAGTAQYFQKLGLDMSIPEIINLWEKRAIYEYGRNIKFKKGAEILLMEAKKRNIKTCILSASSEDAINACLKNLGMLHYFDFVMTCDRAGMKKTEVEIYDYTAELLGVSKSETLFFDDNLQALQTGKKAGLKVVGVYDESSCQYKEEIRETADIYINSFEDLFRPNIVILDRKTLGKGIFLDIVNAEGNTEIYDITTPEQVEERIFDSEIIIANKVKLNETNLKNAKNLRLICVTATGYDNIDIEYCRKKGIAVCNVKGYSTSSVAQVTAATVLSLVTKIFSYRNFVNSGAYAKSGCQNMLEPIFNEISGKTWGIIGYGDIGKKVGEIAKALGCHVIYTRNSPDKNSCSFEYLCQNSDIITIHTPLTDKTRGLINNNAIKMMKDGVIVVNEARGAVTDEQAVAESVLSGKIGAFGCDVFSVEPMSENHPFNKIINMENVCLTPHMAWGALESRQRCVDEIAENIKAYMKGEKRNRIV